MTADAETDDTRAVPRFPRGEAARRALHWWGGALWSRRWLVAAGLALTAAAAADWSGPLASQTFEVRTTLLYNPLVAPDEVPDLGPPADLQTLAATVEALAQPARPRLSGLEVEVPKGTQALVLTLRSHDGREAAERLNLLAERFTLRVALLRRLRLHDLMTDTRTELIQIRDRNRDSSRTDRDRRAGAAAAEARLDLLSRLEQRESEFVVAERAVPPEAPVSDTRVAVMAVLAAVGVMLTLAAAAACELAARGWPAGARAWRLGLAPLAWVGPAGSPGRREGLRGLAVRLRRSAPGPGAVVLFSTLSDAGRADEAVEELAGLLALRDERVLILDARLDPAGGSGESPAFTTGAAGSAEAGSEAGLGVGGSDLSDPSGSWLPGVLRLDGPSGTAASPEAGPCGLGDYLAFATNDLDDVCHPAQGFGVDRLPPGRAGVGPDALATHRAAELLAELRRRYSVVLVLGPPLGREVDLQTAAAHAQGLVAVVDASVPVGRAVRRSLAGLRAAGVPVLGQVVFGEG